MQTMFGGSVRRGTYVSSLSDEDTLLIVNHTRLLNRSPSVVIEQVTTVIQDHLKGNCVTAGKRGVTVKYRKGPEIQILPAIRTDSNGIRLADPGRTGWSKVIRPQVFAEKLNKVDKSNGSRVLPIIKLVKAMANCHIKRESRKIIGYHIEALAIDAFTGYNDQPQTKDMLDHFLTYSMDAVMSRIVDPTGQSRYVDEYLGAANSDRRKRASSYFENTRGRVRNCDSSQKFSELFCL